MGKKKKPQDPGTDETTETNFGIVETKLTRTEVIDLVIQESIDRLNRRQDEIAEEMKEVQDVDVPLRVLRPMGKVRFNPRQGYATRIGKEDVDRFEVGFEVEVSSDDRLQAAFDRWKVLKDEQNRNYQALNALNDRADRKSVV